MQENLRKIQGFGLSFLFFSRDQLCEYAHVNEVSR